MMCSQLPQSANEDSGFVKSCYSGDLSIHRCMCNPLRGDRFDVGVVGDAKTESGTVMVGFLWNIL